METPNAIEAIKYIMEEKGAKTKRFDPLLRMCRQGYLSFLEIGKH